VTVGTFLIASDAEIVKNDMHRLVSEFPWVEFSTFNYVEDAMAPAASYDRLLICATHRFLNSSGAAELSKLLDRHPRALLVMIRGSADLPSLRSLLQTRVSETASYRAPALPGDELADPAWLPAPAAWKDATSVTPSPFGGRSVLRLIDATPSSAASDATGQPQLTGREHEIILLLGGGLGNKLIARRLDLSVSTVKTHLANIFRKLGATNRLDAVYKFAAHSRPAALDPMLPFHQHILASRSAEAYGYLAA
jgi:DNA-binding CsgD family transcriptional regulator